MVLLQLKVLAEVDTSYHLVIRQLLSSTCFKDFTLVKEVGTVGNGESLINIVVGDDNTDILILQGRNDTLDILYRDKSINDFTLKIRRDRIDKIILAVL